MLFKSVAIHYICQMRSAPAVNQTRHLWFSQATRGGIPDEFLIVFRSETGRGGRRLP